MKKFIFIALLSAVMPALMAGNLRIDVSGLPDKAVPQDLSQGGICTTRVRGNDVSQMMIFTANGEWQELSFSIQSPTACKIALNIRSTDETWMLLDDLTADNTVIANGSMEKLRGNGRLLHWQGSKNNVEKKIVKSGKNAMRVTYSVRTSLYNIAIPANTKVTFKGFYRKLDPKAVVQVVKKGKKEAVPFVPPAGANVAYNRSYDGNRPMIVSVGRLELRPTFENCGVYLNSLPEERDKKLNVAFYFRKKGEKDFRRALDPAEIIQEKAWRGSLLLLSENTDYEFKAVLTGSDNYRAEVKGEFRTMNSQVPYETIEIPAGPMKTRFVSGTAEKYKRYTSKGKVVTAPGKNSLAVFEITDLKYVIFDNITVDAKGAQHGFLVNNSENVIIRNCDVYNFGREPGKPVYSALMYYSGGVHTADGKLMYDDCAFRLNNSHKILIERNYAHDPSFSAQTWLFAHPSGPGGIKAIGCTNSVIRYNDFIGRDGARYIDQIISPPNMSFYAGFYRDTDYYGNMFALSNDDGAEIEGGEMNSRTYGNRTEQVFSGLSTGPVIMGPSYVFGNLYANPGDEDGTHGQAYKNGGGKEGENHTRGMLFMMHNTVSDTWASGYGVSSFSIPHKDFAPKLKAILRNNIMRSNGKIFHRRWAELVTDCDGDLMERTAASTPELIAMDDENIRQNKLEPNGIFTKKVEYADPAAGNFAIKPGTPGYKKVHNINNLEHYPQTGAYIGYAGEWFPKRPLDLLTDTTELHWLKGDSRVQQVTVTAGKTMDQEFKIRCNDNFFAVTPAQGKFVPGKAVTFTIKLNEKAMQIPRRYAGAFLVRTADGLSLPITLFVDRTIDSELIMAQKDKFFKADAVKNADGKTAFTFDVPADGTYFMVVRGTAPAGIATGRTMLNFNGSVVKQSVPPIWGTKNLRLIKCDKFRRLEAYKLKKGKISAEFGNVNGVVITEAYLTQVPWELLRNRSRQYKKGK